MAPGRHLEMRMSINVEVIGGSPMVQHYVETLGESSRLTSGVERPRSFWISWVSKASHSTCSARSVVP
jgi:hypothetical protein